MKHLRVLAALQNMKIAFVDHHLNNFHADKFLSLLRGELSGSGLEVCCAFETDPTGDDWCEKNGVARAATLREAVEGADGIIVLAPDNIETHRAFADQVLPLGKPTIFDKLLASTRDDARAIIKLAQQNNAPIFSSSSLRYAVELEAALENESASTRTEAPRECLVRGFGAWNHYGIHTLSLALRIMGFDVKRLIDTGTETARTVTLDYGDGRRAVIDVRQSADAGQQFPWHFAFRDGDEYRAAPVSDSAAFYANLMRQNAKFFTSGETDLTPDNLVETVTLMEAAETSLRAGGEWVSLP